MYWHNDDKHFLLTLPLEVRASHQQVSANLKVTECWKWNSKE